MQEVATGTQSVMVIGSGLQSCELKRPRQILGYRAIKICVHAKPDLNNRAFLLP